MAIIRAEAKAARQAQRARPSTKKGPIRGDAWDPWAWLEGPVADVQRRKLSPRAQLAALPPRPPVIDESVRPLRAVLVPSEQARSECGYQDRPETYIMRPKRIEETQRLFPDGSGRFENLTGRVRPPRRVGDDNFPLPRRIDGAKRYDEGGWRAPFMPRLQDKQACQEWYEAQRPATVTATPIGGILPPPSPRAMARLQAMGLASPRRER